MLVINEDNSFYYKKFENKEKIEDLSYIIQSFYNKKS